VCKYEAYVKVVILVEFEDDGDLNLADQAHEAAMNEAGSLNGFMEAEVIEVAKVKPVGKPR